MATTRTIYLQTIDKEDIQPHIQNAAQHIVLQEEYIPTELALNRITTKALFATASSPAYHSAAMDGIAVRAKDTFLAHETNPIILEEGKTFSYINTGNPLPEQYDAVIMIEHVTPLIDKENSSPHRVCINTPASPWQHVRKIGEDIIATQFLLPEHVTLSPEHIVYLLTAGIWEIPVFELPRIAIIPTGNELIDITERRIPQKGEFLETNSHFLRTLLSPFTSAVTIFPRVEDDEQSIVQTLQYASQQGYHVILLCSGSSSGSKDFTKHAIAKVGTILFHGIRVMPGKPSMLGVTEHNAIIGIPGYTGSAKVCFDEIIAPLLYTLMRQKHATPSTIPAQLAFDIVSRIGIEEQVQVCIASINNTYMAYPLPKFAGSCSSLAKAHGKIYIPRDSEGVQANTTIPVILSTQKHSIEDHIVCIGSHDQSLDLLTAALIAHNTGIFIPIHLGSMGGIQALVAKKTHCAGMHLFDPITKTFNISYLEKYLCGIPVLLCTVAHREQGIIVTKNNPLQIKTLADIARDTIRFVNRQRGSGTRILLDYLLEQDGIPPQMIQGYSNEEYTHLATALTVASGTADCALGIFSAAKALQLDFIPLIEEVYQLVVPLEYVELPAMTSLLDYVQSPHFKKELQLLGGYNTATTGDITYYPA